MLQCPEIMLQAYQMMKTEVCSVGAPHMAPASFWACQTSQLPYSQWQQTPSLFFSPPNIYLSFYPPSKLQAVFQKQSPQTEAVSHGYTAETTVVFARFPFIRAIFQAYLWPRETTTFPCLMKWQNNRFAYAEAGAVTGLTTFDLKHIKKIYQQQLSLRYLGSDGQSKLHHLHRRVLKMTIWIKSWSTNLI